MNKIILAALLAMSACIAAAEEPEVVLDSSIHVVQYTASVSGPVGCIQPYDIQKFKWDEYCMVRKGKLETGWKLVKVGDSCFMDRTKVIRWLKVRAMGTVVDLPETESRRTKTTCPV